MRLVFRFPRLGRLFRSNGADLTIGVLAAAGAAALLGGDHLWSGGRFVYDFGVRGFGAITILVAPVVSGSVIWRMLSATHDPAAWLAALVCAILSVVVTWPLALWLGFVWGSMMSGAWWCREKSSGDGNGLPPAA